MATETQDTEITLGTGKMLVLFFGLVALCSAFFALGFKVGKGSGLDTPLSSTSTTTGTARPSTTKPTANSSDLTFYKSVGQDNPTAPATEDNAARTQTSAAAEEQKTVSDPMTPPASGSYFVQVAAVSKQEDADALVDALKKKQYSAFTNMLADKLYHIQVGPFGDIKDAEVTRAKLVSDGYNPILKK